VSEAVQADFFEEVNFEDLSETKKRVKLKIGSSYIDTVYQKELSNIAKKANFKGFRPGKVPKSMVEKLHGSSLQIQTIDSAVNESIRKCASKREIYVINVTDLEVDPKNFGPESPISKEGLEFSATLVLYPKPEIIAYKEISVTVERPLITDKEVTEAIENIRKSRATLLAVDGRDTPNQEDVVSLDVQISAENQEAGRSEPITTEVQDKNLPEEVRAELLKTKVGESKQVTVAFTDTYADSSLRGKSGTYSLTLKSISERKLPEVDDEFAKSSGLGAENAAELREKTKQALEKEVEERSKSDVEVEILKEIGKKNSFELPQELIDEEIRGLAVRVGIVDPKKVDVSKLPVESLRAPLGEVAAERVRAVIVVDRIAQQESLQAGPEELEAKVKEMATTYGVSEQQIKQYLFQDNGGSNMLMDLTRNKVLDFLKSHAKVEFVEPKAKE
jgi:trigger factor